MDVFRLPNINKIVQNIKLFKAFSQKHKAIGSFVEPKSGSTAFVKLNIKNSSLEFSDDLVEKAGVMTVPAEMFAFGGKYIRIGFGRKDMEETLKVFGDYLEGI